jgi:carbonyl reductase 1
MYGMSKLGEIAWTYTLAKRLSQENILVSAVCPGYCATNMSSYKGPRTPEKGAETPIWLATRDMTVAETGGFWRDQALLSW